LRTLVTSNCTLKPLTVAHAHEMFCVLSDPAIYEFENEPPESEEWLAQRYELLESRRSPDGAERWLNWVIRLPGGELAGYVQATVLPSRTSYIAYELNSRYWRRRIGTRAVTAMLDELHSTYEVHTFVAVFKSANHRSAAFLRSLGFSPASASQTAQLEAESDEHVLVKRIGKSQSAA
jgi:ribosomal-protein-alanine N-acetyltransferase